MSANKRLANLPPLTPQEQMLRHKLGIPADASRVLILAESSHWDPNWLFTSEEYFDRFVRKNLDMAVDELSRDERRVYSIECMFFLRMYWDRQPELNDLMRTLLNQGRLRLTGSGVTTADTILPSVEAILRDWLIGQEWLRTHQINQEPRLMYLTDSFGCSPGLPSLLRAAGFDYTALTRVDGMYFMGSDWEPAGAFPRPGSSAERLLKQEQSLDFVWRDMNGAEVLCHWNAFTYGQGDMLTHRGLGRIYLFPWSLPDTSEHHVAQRIKQFVRQLLPLARTPYLFCPIGFDFVPPLRDLVKLLDRYNQRRYPSTGIWAVNAGLDDYMALVDCHRDRLPVLELDPNPYWSGFYTSRPALKKQCHTLVDHLLLAERWATASGKDAAADHIGEELHDAWWDAVTANHHDFITGTSPDEVVYNEQIPWLVGADKKASMVISRASYSAPTVQPAASPRLPEYKRDDHLVHIHTRHYVLEMDTRCGGCITNLIYAGMSWPALRACSNDLISYQDSGGLWRMGHEFRGGMFKPTARAGDQPIQVDIGELNGGLQMHWESQLDGEMIQRAMWFHNDDPFIRLRVQGRAATQHTVTVRLRTGQTASRLLMDTSGGLVSRPQHKIYTPTFWPLYHLACVQHEAAPWSLVIAQAYPGAIACLDDGDIELVALRNATRERAFGFVPLLANPAAGYEKEIYSFDYAISVIPSGEQPGNNLLALAYGDWSRPWQAGLPQPHSILTTAPDTVQILAIKPACRQAGLVVRLYTPIPSEQPVQLIAGRDIQAACLCDARERDLAALPVDRNTVSVHMSGVLATIRLVLTP